MDCPTPEGKSQGLPDSGEKSAAFDNMSLPGANRGGRCGVLLCSRQVSHTPPGHMPEMPNVVQGVSHLLQASFPHPTRQGDGQLRPAEGERGRRHEGGGAPVPAKADASLVSGPLVGAAGAFEAQRLGSSCPSPGPGEPARSPSRRGEVDSPTSPDCWRTSSSPVCWRCLFRRGRHA